MADEEERLKAEKLAAAKKRVAQLQKQKKKASKKPASSDTPKESETPESSSTPPPPPPDADAATPEEPATGEKDDEPQSTQPETQEESPTEPMPEAPTSLNPEDEPLATKLDTPRAGHTRQASLSIQSKMRSSSFRKSSVSQGSMSTSPSATLKSPSLPPLSADGESVHEVYRKQSTRIEELEKDNKRLEKELEDATTRWKKTEDQLEDLREAGVDVAELQEKLQRAEKKAEGIDELKAEIASLQRHNSHLQTRTHRSNASISVPGSSESPPSDLMQQLESKAAAMEAMELEISNLRAQSESALEKSQRELADVKSALTRASEKAVREGVDKTSTETLIKTLQREVEELKQEKAEGEKKIESLEKKLQAIGNLHKESESRHQARLRESEKFEKEAAVLRKKLASVENENLRLKEEQEALRKREAGGTDDDAIDELEDEERSRLQRRIRELEGEVFDLRRGVWQEKRQELVQGEDTGIVAPDYPSYNPNPAANAFDDVDLIGGSPEHARRRSMAHQQQHSSFSTVLSSGIAAFTGGNALYGNRGRAPSNQHQHPPATRGSLELLSEENFDDEFDEAEFARAQAEEEARKRVEWVREIKRKLRDWNGWRLDLVDSRAGAEGAGVGMGEIFEI
ncbi:hypothetical protein ARAM_006193 [Aspergillus rambellii]|uniref:M protein repeat protein n=1 Tax=Aspergillus rambellii TaxID=308745 RepID=A0A0F8UC00_9EURO|nr:hypothetical protein ARAM_006193 [Aspergillus rambellii]